MSIVGSAHPLRVVVGIDGSEQSKQALRWAARIGSVAHARLEVVGTWHFPTTCASAYGWAAISPEWDPAQDMEKVVIAAVDEVFGPRRPTELQVTIREGGAARILLEESEGALMLVVGSRGHGGFAGMLLGSVSSSVAEHATCPVLVVHGDGLPPEVP